MSESSTDENVIVVMNISNTSSFMLTYDLPVTATLIVCYLLIFMVAIFGNVVVIWSVVRNSAMRSVMNYFICNMSVADLLGAIFVLPITLLQTIFIEWHWGSVLCRGIPYLQGVSVSASIFNLSVIAFDRYMAICHPLKRYITIQRAKIIIFCIWMIAGILISPWLFFYQIKQKGEMTFCNEDWTPWLDASARKYFFIGVIFVSLYAIPLLFISIFYCLVACKIWRRIDMQQNGSRNNSKHNSNSRRGQTGHSNASSVNLTSSGGIDRCKTIKVIKMLATVVALFALSWLPLYTIFMMIYFGLNFNMQSVLIPLAQLLGASNFGVNPWIYCLYSENYRRSFIAILKCQSPPRYAPASMMHHHNRNHLHTRGKTSVDINGRAETEHCCKLLQIHAPENRPQNEIEKQEEVKFVHQESSV